jgi:2-polyprenyl-3-methyl-5-hydroxy-6-metoxy-1,4-benzoquinol methylase
MSEQQEIENEDVIKPDIHSSSQEYRQRFFGGVGQWFLDRQNGITEDMLSVLGNDLTAIDFGGGHGQSIQVCQQLQIEYTILGSAAECFELLEKEYSNTELNTRVGSLTDSGCAEQSFDVVMSYRMLPHLKFWQAHIQELCRVSRNTVLIEFPSRRSINALSDRFFGLKKSIEGNTRRFTLFSLDQVIVEFESQGFKLAEVRGQYLLPMALHRALKNKKVSTFLENMVGVLIPHNKFGSPLICKFERLHP